MGAVTESDVSIVERRCSSLNLVFFVACLIVALSGQAAEPLLRSLPGGLGEHATTNDQITVISASSSDVPAVLVTDRVTALEAVIAWITGMISDAGLADASGHTPGAGGSSSLELPFPDGLLT